MTLVAGRIANISYQDHRSGFAVIHLQPPSGGDLVTVVGGLAHTLPGEHLKVWGTWKEHPRFGRQLQAERYEVSQPATLEGIRAYLGSGLASGIGPRAAERIVERFAADTPRVIEEQPERLAEVAGLNPEKIDALVQAWRSQSRVRTAMIALQSLGVSSAVAVRIYGRYGEHAPAIVRSDPYRLAVDVEGIGFQIADRIARAAGVAADAQTRLEAGLLHTLDLSVEEGHVFLLQPDLLQRAQQLLDVDRVGLVTAVQRAATRGQVVIDGEAVYRPALHAAETGIAASLKRLATAPWSLDTTEVEAPVAWVQGHLGLELAPRQQEAVALALEQKLLVITGGPGTGKTTILRSLLAIARRLQARVLLAAPTGRSAKRMSEATGAPARTIHRLLEFRPREGVFARTATAPLECDLLVVDEASMVDLPLLDQLLQALPDSSSLGSWSVIPGSCPPWGLAAFWRT